MNLLQYFPVALRQLIISGQERSVKAKKNILLSLFVKGGSILVNLSLVPVAIHYVSAAQYGVWLTVSSMVGWFSFFDIGLTQGLRNSFAKARAGSDEELARTYVSTASALLTIMVALVWLSLMILDQYLDWRTLLGVEGVTGREMSLVFRIVVSYFCLQLALKIVPTILTADQRSGSAALMDLVGQVLSLLVIVVLTSTTRGSLVYLGLGLCLPPILISLVVGSIMFSGRYSSVSPSFRFVRLSHARSLLGLGIAFFVIQVASVVQYQTANVVILKSFGPVEVTAYNIVFKYFSVLSMVFLIFVTPFWSASTEAFHFKDVAWIKSAMRKYNTLTLYFVAAGIVMFLVYDRVFLLWLGANAPKVDRMMAFSALLFFIGNLFAVKYVYFLNGIGAIRLQFYLSMVSPFIYIGLCWLFIQTLGMGPASLFFAALLSNLNGVVVAPLQYRKVLKDLSAKSTTHE